MFRYLALIAFFLPAPAVAEQIRSANFRVIDGDTVDVGNERFRLVGYDTPETYRAQCDYELALGRAATARLQDLLNGVQIVELVVLPGRDRYGRGLARLVIAQRDVGDTLVSEGLARPYDGGRREPWC